MKQKTYNTSPPTHGEKESKSFHFAAVSTPPQHHLSSVYFAVISEETLWRLCELCAFISVP